jgi:hypothetical protein
MACHGILASRSSPTFATTVRLMIAFARRELKAAVWCLHAGLIGRPVAHRAIRVARGLNGAALRLLGDQSADRR